jgi:transposase InsO family protein
VLRRPFEFTQYASEGYREILAQHGFIGSMSRRGNPYDNAKAESFMKTLKCEEVVCCESFIGDGGRYPGVGLQGQASNRHKLRG